MSTKTKDKETESFKQLVSSRFEELRNDLQLSQQELADVVGTTQNLIFRMENDLKASTTSMFMLFLFYHKNYNINPEWLFTPRNTDVPKYYNDIKLSKRKKDAEESRRSEILTKMLKELKDNNLIPSDIS